MLSAEATPKAIMRTMNVKGLTLFHLKSHLQVSLILIIMPCPILSFAMKAESFFAALQKYRLGKQSGKDMGEGCKDGMIVIPPLWTFQL